MKVFESILLALITTSSSSLFAAEGPIPPEPGPYEVRLERSPFVSMRDGIRLSTDLYMPVDVDHPVGTVLERTPYNKGSELFRAEV